MTIPFEQAQRDLAKLLDQVAAGEEMVITRNGLPVARMIAEKNGTHLKKPDRVPGSAKGMIISIAPDFDAPLDDMREYME